MNILEVENINKYFGGLQAIKDLSFSIEKNTITALIGPNGAGKTTLFNILTGFSQEDSGEVFFKGKSIVKFSPDRINRIGIVRTFQMNRMLKNLSVLENILLGYRNPIGESVLASFIRFPGQEVYEKKILREACGILSLVGLDKCKDTFAKNLGFGQQKLVEIARALATNAELILLDEPTSGLSSDMIKFVISLIRKLKSSGKTVFIIEHNMKVVMEIAEKIIVIDFGEKIAEGPPNFIKNNIKVINAYFGKN